MKPSNEFCIKFLEASGWLDNHDKRIRIDVIDECIDAIVYCVSASECDETLNELKEQK